MIKGSPIPGDLAAGDHDEKPRSSFGIPKGGRRFLIGDFRDRTLLVQAYILFLFSADSIALCTAGQKLLNLHCSCLGLVQPACMRLLLNTSQRGLTPGLARRLSSIVRFVKLGESWYSLLDRIRSSQSLHHGTIGQLKISLLPAYGNGNLGSCFGERLDRAILWLSSEMTPAVHRLSNKF